MISYIKPPLSLVYLVMRIDYNRLNNGFINDLNYITVEMIFTINEDSLYGTFRRIDILPLLLTQKTHHIAKKTNH